MSVTSTETLPKDWKSGQLGKFCEMYQPRTISTKELIEDGAFPVYGANGQIGFYHKFNHPDAEVTVTCRGATCGTVNVIPAMSWITGNAMVVKPLRGCMTKEFLNYALQSLNFTKVITGTAQPQITRTTLTTIEISVPPLAEQEKIVEILEEQLSRLDAALICVRTVRDKAAQFRRSLLHAAFKGALTGHNTSSGTLPKGWEEKSLGEVAKWGSGGTPKSDVKKYYGGDIPWTVIGDLTEGLVQETAKTITQEGLDSSSAKIVKPGTVLLAMYGASIGRTGIAGTSMATNQAIAYAVPDMQFLGNEYLLKFLQSQKRAFVKAGQGGAQPNISQTVIKVWPIPVPPLAEQTKIVEILDEQLTNLDASLAAVNVAESRATALRRSLLHAAFTGQITKYWRESNS